MSRKEPCFSGIIGWFWSQNGWFKESVLQIGLFSYKGNLVVLGAGVFGITGACCRVLPRLRGAGAVRCLMPVKYHSTDGTREDADAA